MVTTVPIHIPIIIAITMQCLLLCTAQPAQHPQHPNHMQLASDSSVHLVVYNSTALAGAVVFNGSVPNVSLASSTPRLQSSGSYTAVFTGMISPPSPEFIVFGLDTDQNVGVARLWVDDRLIIDTTATNSAPSHNPISLKNGYTEWPGANIDTAKYSMRDVGGDCSRSSCPTWDKCIELCDSLKKYGCIGFVSSGSENNFQACYMRRRAPNQTNCSDAIYPDKSYTTVTNDEMLCTFDPKWRPGYVNATAKLAVQVPFFPSAIGARFRLEYTASPDTSDRSIRLLVNGSDIDSTWLSDAVSSSELQYFDERAEAEIGWNTWLSGDLLTHAYLPHGISARLSFVSPATNTSLSYLGENGPACNRESFPVTHGLHATRGQYTELSSVDFNGGSYKVESASVSTGNGESEASYVILVTTLQPAQSKTILQVDVNVPQPWAPRECFVDIDTGMSKPAAVATCPGLQPVEFSSSDSSAEVNNDGFQIVLSQAAGSATSLYAYFPRQALPDPKFSTTAATKIVSEARSVLINQFAAFGSKNETFAGMKTAVSWNVIYTPYEGIFIPVFRGSPWSVSKPHNYVLFEWDTYLSSMIASNVDKWVAKSNIIRMTKSLIAGKGGGYVAGFWNGLCGEVDKSKPPVGAMALQYLINSDLGQSWVADLLIDQLVMWNGWWNIRMKDGLIAPGSTREMLSSPISCISQSPVGASRCETGLDNSPLYDGAKFIESSDVIDSVDVGMTALLANDAAILANLSRQLGRQSYADELESRAHTLRSDLSAKMWSESDGLYFNRMWYPTSNWAPKVAAPTNFYPMLASIPTDVQVSRMVRRWLMNSSEFAVGSVNVSHGMPSVSRSCPAFQDNSYWRGRTWGPMNWLVYLGLKNYKHLDEVQDALAALALQSEATFLVEWTANHRVMENYNSVSGIGCDVGNASPFYHWGALTALTALDFAGFIV